MKQILAWYLEGWDDDQDDFDETLPERCETCKELPSVPSNPRRLQDARDRRLVLIEAGLATYELNIHDSSIVCLCCGMVSANRNDIANLYCGFCHDFHTQKLSPPPLESPHARP